jgi:hypothetical protein
VDVIPSSDDAALVATQTEESQMISADNTQVETQADEIQMEVRYLLASMAWPFITGLQNVCSPEPLDWPPSPTNDSSTAVEMN